MKTIGLILARGGSKGIPHKNARKFGGKPLVAWTIEAAMKSLVCSAVYVTTEDEEIAEISSFWGATVLPRPKCLADDKTQSAEVCRFALRQLSEQSINPETVIILPPTAPFRTEKHIAEAYITEYRGEGTVLSVFYDKKYHWHSLEYSIHPVDILPQERLGRDDNEGYLCQEAGSIYITGVQRFLQTGNYYTPPYILYVMDKRDCIDLDTEYDWWLAERILEYRNGNKRTD